MLPDPNTPAGASACPLAPTTLAVFLAQRDEPCPKCGYNLRGAQAAACPECGTTLELTVRRVAPLAGYALFLLLAFGWLFAAGTMNAVRSTRTIIAMAQPSQFQTFFSVNGTLGVSGSRIFQVTPSGPGPTITIQSPTVTMTVPPSMSISSAPKPAAADISEPNTTPEANSADSSNDAAPEASQDSAIDPSSVTSSEPASAVVEGSLSPAAPLPIIAQRTFARAQAIQSGATSSGWQQFGNANISSGFQPSSAWQWSNIDPNTWVRASWAYILALGGFMGLLLLALYHRRGCTVSARRRLVRAAALLFLVYAGAHVFWFSQEVFNLW